LRSNASAFVSATLVPAVGFYDAPEGLVEQNIEEGLKLLDEAGFPNGRGLPTVTALVAPGGAADTVLRAAAEIWEERLGLEVEFIPLRFSQYTELTRRGGYVIGSSTWIGDFADPLSFLQMWTTESNLNDARYSSSRYDSLINQAMSENDENRFDTLAKAEEMLLSGEVVVIPLANPPSFNLIDTERISGWYSNALDIHPFKYMGFREPDVPDWYISVPAPAELALGTID
jgi:peptide/nickel transport system substrate-binding protein/oligopeptide transport system substrate-binding protein